MTAPFGQVVWPFLYFIRPVENTNWQYTNNKCSSTCCWLSLLPSRFSSNISNNRWRIIIIIRNIRILSVEMTVYLIQPFFRTQDRADLSELSSQHELSKKWETIQSGESLIVFATASTWEFVGCATVLQVTVCYYYLDYVSFYNTYILLKIKKTSDIWITLIVCCPNGLHWKVNKSKLSGDNFAMYDL